MANPTTAKPTGYFTEKVQTAATVGELMRCQLPLLGAGAPRCPFLNLVAETQISRSGGGTGHAPAIEPTGFDAGGLSDPAYRFSAGTTALKVQGAGWGASPANPRTMFAVIRPLAVPGAATRTTQILTNGTDTGFYGIGIQISTAGVITLGSMIGTTFTTAGITLASGKWYLISLTYTSTTARAWNVYCYTDQAYVTSEVTSPTTSEGAYGGPSQPDLVFNAQNSIDSYQVTGFLGSLYTCGFTDASMAISANAYFAALVADPLAACRGTNAGGGPLTAGGCVNWDATTGHVDIHSNRPSGGTPAGYQFRLHRSKTPAFNPDTTTRVTALQSSPRLRDTSAVARTNYWYKVEQTDGVSTVYSTTATTNKTQTPGRLSRGDFFFGLIGDSRYASTGLASAMNICFALRALGFRAGVANAALGGTLINSGTPAVSWQPNMTQDPVNGQASTVLLANAEALFDIAEVDNVVIEPGVNDCNSGVAPATTIAKLANITAYEIAQGRRCVLLRPYIQTSGSETHQAATQAYGELLRALDNGGTIRVAADHSFNLSMSAHEALTRDYLHCNFSALEGMAAATAIIEGLGLNAAEDATFTVADNGDGTGGVATITGTGDSARNAIHVYSTAGNLVGTFKRIGDGGVAVSADPGTYLGSLSVDGLAVDALSLFTATLAGSVVAGLSDAPRNEWLITDADGNVWTVLQVIHELQGVSGAFDILPDRKAVTVSPRNPTAANVTVLGVRRPWIQQEASRFGEGVANHGPEKTVFLLPGIGSGPRIYRCSAIKQQA